MAGLIDAIRDLMDNLFHRDPKQIQKRKELRRIADYLKSVRPAYYKPGNPLVLPGFAAILYDFTKLLLPIYNLLSKTIANADPKLSALYKNYLVQSRLPEKERNKLKTFTYELIQERILNSVSPESELKLIGNEFQSIIKLFSTPEFGNFDIEYNQLEKLKSLCSLDYEKILNLFDSKLRLSSPKYKPSFSPVPAEDIINDILDIYYLIWGFEISLGIEKNLLLLLERFKKTNTEEFKFGIKKIINRLQQLLKKHLSPTTLLFLIRAIKEDPFFTPPVDKEMHFYLETYKKKLTDQFQHIRDRIMRERREDAIAQDLKSLFGNAELLKVQGYSEEFNDILSEDGFETFKYIKPLMIVKSFSVGKFERNIRENVNKLIVEGYFESEAFQNKLSNLYYTCEKIMNGIIEFEEELTGESKSSIKSMEKYIHLYHTGKNVAPLLNRVIQSVNSKAFSIIDNTTNLFYKLASIILEIVNDYKQNTPSYISNLKVIGGVNNREFMGNVVKDYNDLIKFVRIMKNFIILETTVKTAPKQKVPASETADRPSRTKRPAGLSRPAQSSGTSGLRSLND